MVETATFHTLSFLCQRYPLVLISGPFGCNAETLARRLMPSKSFIDLENDQIFRLAKESPRTFLMAFPDGLIIKAIDRLPSMMDAIRYMIGKWGYTSGKYIAISNNMQVSDGSDERTARIEVAGLSVDDLERLKLPYNNPFQIIYGGQLQLVADGSFSIDSIISHLLENIIIRHINGSNLGLFLKFMNVCASESSASFSLNSIAKQTGISAPTAKVWFSILEQNLVIRILTSSDSGKREFFFSDTGILCRLLGIGSKEDLILSPHRQRIVRTFVVNELLRGRFSKNLERNLLLCNSNDFDAAWKDNYSIVVEPNIEITEARMEKAKSTPNDSKPLILYLGDVTYSRDGIDCIGYRDWIKLAMEIDYFS